MEYTTGVVNTAPVNIGDPPVGVVYHLKDVPVVVDEAVNVVDCPELILRTGGFTATSGIVLVFITTTPLAREDDGVLVTGAKASA